MKRRMLCLVLAALVPLLGGCGGESAEEDGRTVVTMLFTDDLAGFEALVEETYPDIDLRVECNAEATIDGESERRLRNGRGPSIVATTMPTGSVREYVLDLHAEPYAGRYLRAEESGAEDGRAMFIPLPGQYYGYIYNATLAERGNIPAAETQLGILDMLDAAAAQGLGVGEDGTLFGAAPVLSAFSSWLLATRLPDFLGLPEGAAWSEGVRGGEAGFAEGMRDCLKLVGQLAERGYLNGEALDPRAQAVSAYDGSAAPLKRRMLSGGMLMAYGSTRLHAYLNERSGEYEYGMLPFLSDAGNPAWTLAAPDAYLSINAELGEAEREACGRVLDLLSTPEGQQAYIEDCGAAYSYLIDCACDYADAPEGLRECVEGGRVYDVRLPAGLLDCFGRQMADALSDRATPEEALAAVDAYARGEAGDARNAAPVGRVAADLLCENYDVRWGETALGNLVADAVRELTGAQIAFVNGGAIRGSLYAGAVTGADLTAVCPYGSRIVTLEVDGGTIREMLANGLSAMSKQSEIPGGRFLNVSGLRYSFHAPEGNNSAELMEVALADGTPIGGTARYSIAVNDYMCGRDGYANGSGDGFAMLNLYCEEAPRPEGVKLLEETEATYADALAAYFAGRGDAAVVAKCDGRIRIVNGGR